MKNSEGNDNKKLIVILSVLVGLIAVLVVAIVVAHNILITESVGDGMNWEERQDAIKLANGDCVGIQELYSSGIMTKEEADNTYDRKIKELSDNMVYRIYLTICYVQYMHYNGATFDETIGMLKGIEPYLKEKDDFIEYYDRLVVYYVEADDWENARHYGDLRDKLMVQDYYKSESEDAE